MAYSSCGDNLFCYSFARRLCYNRVYACIDVKNVKATTLCKVAYGDIRLRIEVLAEISVFNQSGERRWSRYASDFRTISEKTQQVLKLEGLRSASVIFVTPQMIHEMNRDYRGIDRPTDVISPPYGARGCI